MEKNKADIILWVADNKYALTYTGTGRQRPDIELTADILGKPKLIKFEGEDTDFPLYFASGHIAGFQLKACY
jgi:hypothetical protein